VVAALESVTLVTLFDRKRAAFSTADRAPEVYAKGGDYDMERIPEAQLARTWCAQLVAIRVRTRTNRPPRC